MTYTINYIDNQGKARTVPVSASTWGEAMTRVESNANEQGHGVASVGSCVRDGEV